MTATTLLPGDIYETAPEALAVAEAVPGARTAPEAGTLPEAEALPEGQRVRPAWPDKGPTPGPATGGQPPLPRDLVLRALI